MAKYTHLTKTRTNATLRLAHTSDTAALKWHLGTVPDLELDELEDWAKRWAVVLETNTGRLTFLDPVPGRTRRESSPVPYATVKRLLDETRNELTRRCDL
jgi:hypothetical protein